MDSRAATRLRAVLPWIAALGVWDLLGAVGLVVAWPHLGGSPIDALTRADGFAQGLVALWVVGSVALTGALIAKLIAARDDAAR